MNIKGLLGNTLAAPVRPTDKVDRAIKSDSAHDRDANGQQTFDQNQHQQQGPMSDEMLQKAIEHLRQLPAVKEHKWTVELVIEDEKKYVLIKDNLKNTIRRIPELELWSLPMDEIAPKGNLLKKTA